MPWHKPKRVSSYTLTLVFPISSETRHLRISGFWMTITYVSWHIYGLLVLVPYYHSPAQHTSAYVIIRNHTSAYVSDDGEVAHIYMWSCCKSYPIVTVSSVRTSRIRNNPIYCVSSYCYICVLILLYMCWQTLKIHKGRSDYPMSPQKPKSVSSDQADSTWDPSLPKTLGGNVSKCTREIGEGKNFSHVEGTDWIGEGKNLPTDSLDPEKTSYLGRWQRRDVSLLHQPTDSPCNYWRNIYRLTGLGFREQKKNISFFFLHEQKNCLFEETIYSLWFFVLSYWNVCIISSILPCPCTTT